MYTLVSLCDLNLHSLDYLEKLNIYIYMHIWREIYTPLYVGHLDLSLL